MSTPRCALCAAIAPECGWADRVFLCTSCGDLVNDARPAGCFIEENERPDFTARLRTTLERFFAHEHRAADARANKRERQRRRERAL